MCQAVDANLVNIAVHMHLITLHSPICTEAQTLVMVFFLCQEQWKGCLEKRNICIWGGAEHPATTGVIFFVSLVVPFVILFVYILEGWGTVSIPFCTQAHCIDQ